MLSLPLLIFTQMTQVCKTPGHFAASALPVFPAARLKLISVLLFMAFIFAWLVVRALTVSFSLAEGGSQLIVILSVTRNITRLVRLARHLSFSSVRRNNRRLCCRLGSRSLSRLNRLGRSNCRCRRLCLHRRRFRLLHRVILDIDISDRISLQELPVPVY